MAGIWQLGAVTAANTWELGSEGSYSAAFSIDTVGTNNAFADGATGITVTGVDLDTVTSAIIETDDSAHQSDVTASFSAAVDGLSATFNHTRGAVPLSTSSWQVRLALSDGVTTVYRNVTINPASGYQVVELAGTPLTTAPESGVAPYTGPDPVIKDQIIAPLTTPLGAPIVVNADGSLGYDYRNVDPVPSSEDHSLEAWSSNGTSRVWSSTTITIAEATLATTSVDVPAAATYGPGDTLAFVVHWGKNAYVTGTPRIALTVGSGTVYADYASGHGTNALTFIATIPTGDQYTGGVAVGALELNGGTIQDSGGTNATLTLNNVGSMTGVVVDTQGPAITSVSVPASGTYAAGEVLEFIANWDETVAVSGSPRIRLLVGGFNRYATYQSQTGASALKFAYTVQVGDEDTNGITVAELQLNGGQINDNQGNDATLTLNSVGNTTGVLVDAIGPEMTGVDVPAGGTYTPGQTLSFTVNYNEAVTVTTTGGTPRLVLNMGGSAVYPLYVSGSGTTALVFEYTVQDGDFDTDGIYIAALEANGGTLKGADTNDADLTLVGVSDTSAILVDGVSPILTIDDITTTDISPVASGTCGDAASLTLVVTDGGAYSRTYNITPTGSNWSQQLDTMSAGSYTMTLDGEDALGNQSTQVVGTLQIADALSVDSVAVPAASTYGVGEVLAFTVNWNIPASVTGTPALELIIGSQTVLALYTGGDGTTALTFEYTVKNGDLDEDGIVVNSLVLNGGAIEDDLNQGALLGLNGVGDTSGVHVVAVTIDLIPDQFSFPTKINQVAGTLVESNPITVTGVTPGRDIPLTITDGEYAISTDGGASYGAWGTAPTNVRLNHLVKVRHTTSANDGTGETTTLDLNGVSAQFMTVTQAAGGGGGVDLSAIAQPIASSI